MAEKKKKEVNKRMRLIDPVYKKFTARAFQSMTSTEFYEMFMAMMAEGQHEFQFSNRKLDKQVDERWVNIIEDTLPAIDEICRNPRIIITQEELITNVAQARKVNSQVIKHLCSHGDLIEDFNEGTGAVRPSRILNIFKEESWDTYENRFVYTLLKKTYDFVAIRYRDLFKQMDDEYGANLKIDSTAISSLETVHMKMELKIRQIDDVLDTNAKNDNIFARIKKIYETLLKLMETRFAKEMKNYPKVTPPLVPTNAIKKNPLLKKCQKLWDFLLAYKDVGYSIEVIEQNPEINEKFEQDILNDIMFTYIILKGYLEDKRDRAIAAGMKVRKRKFHPKYIREIVEELVRNYDLPDVEVRKVLVEELTRAQLMREQEQERYRIVQEQERAKREEKKKAEQEKRRLAKEKEKEALRLAKEKEKEQLRLQKEKEQEEARKKREKERKEKEDLRRGDLIEEELKRFRESLEKTVKTGKKTETEKEEKETKKEKRKKTKKVPEPKPAEPEIPAETIESQIPAEIVESQIPAETTEPEHVAEERSQEETFPDEQIPEVATEPPAVEEEPEKTPAGIRQRLSKWLKGNNRGHGEN